MNTETQFISRRSCKETIQLSEGRRFWVKFRKKDNSLREMEAEVRPRKDTDNKSPSDYNDDLIVVGDRKVYNQLIAKGAEPEKANDASYRSITISTILEFKINNVLYIVED